MSRARPASGATISLFPFLAVLLCTMGALLVLLVLFSRSAKHSERAAAEAAVRQREDDLRLEQEQLSWRLEQLRAVRDRTLADLARARMQLAGVEDDNRTLADELDGLERLAMALAEDAPPSGADAAARADLERRLKNARESLDEAKRKQADRPPAYAVVPYEGAHGTHRRPLYIECCIDGVFLQPEGIRLGPADFEGPPGPGNPLASALRAAREHLAKGPRETGDPAAQPYPLLLVRPSGVMAYYAARESIQSWGSEFGYQFVDEDWTLDYPPRDPVLADAEQRAVEEARRRIAWLGEVRKSRPAKPVQQFRAATTRGGVVAADGPSVLGDQSRFDWTEEQAAAARQGGPGRGFTAAEAGEPGRGFADGEAGGDAILGGRGVGGGPGGTGTLPGGTAAGPGESANSGGGPGGSGGGSGFGDRYSGPSKFYAADAGATAGGTAEGGSPTGGTAGGTGTGTASAENGAAGGTSAGTTGATTGGSGSAGATGVARAGAAGQSGGAAGSSAGPALPGLAQPGGAAGGMIEGSRDAASGGSASVSLAGKRGSNWASLATRDRPIPLRRPIRIECAADEFRILDEGGSRVETRIPIGGHTADAIDPLVSAVHAKVGRWGIAGDRMYWKPELVLAETPDGRSRREELERLLADSGLETRPAAGRDQVRPLPPVDRTGAVAAPKR
ncbi:MAG: hypothetical protein ACKOC4_10875 [Planctomycetia bacterium]